MGLDLVNIARTGIARTGLARLNAGEVRYSAGAAIGARPDIPDNPSGRFYYRDDWSSGLDGWSAYLATNTIEGSRVKSVAAGWRPNMQIAGSQYDDRYIYVKITSDQVIENVYIEKDVMNSLVPMDLIRISSYEVVAYALISLADRNLLWFSVTGATTAYFETVYIGDGTYLYTNSLSTSGSGYVTVNPYYGQASGQAITSGEALSAAHYIGQAAGQADLSGSALYAISYAPTAQGQADTSGAADYTTDYKPAASGQLDATGDAPGLPCYLADAGGQLDTSGTAPGFPEMIGPASGTATLSGLASPLAAHYHDTTGGAGGAGIDGTAPVIFTIDVKGLPVFVRRFDGDVRLTLSETGGIIRIRGGQPEMDDGLTTAVNISLLSEGDWWGNALAAKGEDIGSGFLAALNAPLTNRARLDIIEAARSALAWLTDTGIAQAVDVSATIPSAGQLALTITIRQPERSPSTFRYTVNWAAQRVQLQEIAA